MRPKPIAAIGASMHWLREVARRSPGYMTEIGLGCYIDPDQTCGRLTAQVDPESLVDNIRFRGKRYLFYPTWKSTSPLFAPARPGRTPETCR